MERGETRGDWGGLMGGHCDIVVNSRRRRVSQTASEHAWSKHCHVTQTWWSEVDRLTSRHVSHARFSSQTVSLTWLFLLSHFTVCTAARAVVSTMMPVNGEAQYLTTPKPRNRKICRGDYDISPCKWKTTNGFPPHRPISDSTNFLVLIALWYHRDSR